MPELKNCPECGKIYIENPMKLCHDCKNKELEVEDIVAKFLRETRKASITEIHQATGVKEKIILRMLNRGRITGDFEISYPCETCGAPITDGRVCGKCSKNIIDQMPKPEEWKAREQTEPQKVHGRMYTKDSR